MVLIRLFMIVFVRLFSSFRIASVILADRPPLYKSLRLHTPLFARVRDFMKCAQST